MTLTTMQTKVMLLICEGHSTKIVADKLGISHHTAKFHLGAAMRRLKAGSRTLAAVRFALADGNRDAVSSAVAVAA